MVWGTSAWAGKEFLFNGTRDAPHIVTVYAFEDNSDVEIFLGASQVGTTVTSNQDQSNTFSLAVDGKYKLISTGLIIAFMHSNASGNITDPKPLMPSSTDIIGFPSTTARVTSKTSVNDYTAIHSDSYSEAGSLTAGVTQTIYPRRITTLYESESLRIQSNDSIVANSNADSNGYCSSTFVPVTMMKKKYAINVSADYVAFASIEPGDITVTAPGGATSTLALTKSGSNPKAPYRARLGTTPAGYRFESTTKFAAWYQPDSDVGGADEDETIMFGW